MKNALAVILLAVLTIGSALAAEPAESSKPNIVFILADDLGYADLSCYGSKEIRTPHLDKMATEGMKFTDFYAAACVCTPTRAAFLTGCYPKRVGLHNAVLQSKTKSGLNPSEITLAELLKAQGYATACIGKWHLGEQEAVLPLAQGFDYYFGMPGPNHNMSDLYRNNELIAKKKNIDRDRLTVRYTEEAVKFIRERKDKPFFLYLPHSAPHTPLYASKKFRGTSRQGLRGDMIQEIDWSCGEILKTIKELGLDETTLVIFTSDNGQSGVAAQPLHGGKGQSWEAGFRVPFVARWPKRIPAGAVSDEFATIMDMLPTMAPLAGAQVPTDRKIDGKDIWPLLSRKPDARSEYDAFFYYVRDSQLSAVRQGKWKLHLRAPSERWAGKLPKEALLATKPKTAPPWLYDLNEDIGETKNVAEENPEVVESLTKLGKEFDRKLSEEMRPAYGANVRKRPKRISK
jgi:arylsulfatase A